MEKHAACIFVVIVIYQSSTIRYRTFWFYQRLPYLFARVMCLWNKLCSKANCYKYVDVKKNHFSWHTSTSGIFPAESSAPKYLSTGYSELNFSISVKLHFEKRSHESTYCSGFTHPASGKCFCFSAYASSCTTSSESEVSNWSSFRSSRLPLPLQRPHFQGSSLVPHLLMSVSLFCSFNDFPFSL